MGARQMMPIPPAANQTSTSSATIAMWHFDELNAEVRMLRARLAAESVGRGALVWTLSLLLATSAGATLGYLGAVLQVCR